MSRSTRRAALLLGMALAGLGLHPEDRTTIRILAALAIVEAAIPREEKP